MKAGDEVKQTGFRLPQSVIDKLDRIAKQDYRNRTQMVIALIERAAKSQEVNDDSSC